MQDKKQKDVERLMRRVVMDQQTGCWVWTGQKDADGYGKFKFRGQMLGAHRVSFILHRGEIPKGYALDHAVCQRRDCVNPWHMEVCTPSENSKRNVLRGVGAGAINAAKVECVHGHPFDDANTYKWRGRRGCRACNRLAVRRLRERRKAALGKSVRHGHVATATGVVATGA